MLNSITSPKPRRLPKMSPKQGLGVFQSLKPAQYGQSPTITVVPSIESLPKIDEGKETNINMKRVRGKKGLLTVTSRSKLPHHSDL